MTHTARRRFGLQRADAQTKARCRDVDVVAPAAMAARATV